MKVLFWLVFLVGVVVIVSTIFKVVWQAMAVPLMLLGGVFDFLLGLLPVAIIGCLVLGLVWACGNRLPLRRWRCYMPRRAFWRRWM